MNSHSGSDKDHNISAAFEEADISLALISLGLCSLGSPQMVWVGQVFCQLCFLAGLRSLEIVLPSVQFSVL